MIFQNETVRFTWIIPPTLHPKSVAPDIKTHLPNGIVVTVKNGNLSPTATDLEIAAFGKIENFEYNEPTADTAGKLTWTKAHEQIGVFTIYIGEIYIDENKFEAFRKFKTMVYSVTPKIVIHSTKEITSTLDY